MCLVSKPLLTRQTPPPQNAPKMINTLYINNFKKDIAFLIEQLFHTDFNRCYQSMKELEKSPSDEVLYHLNNNWDRAKSDYGAISVSYTHLTLPTILRV